MLDQILLKFGQKLQNIVFDFSHEPRTGFMLLAYCWRPLLGVLFSTILHYNIVEKHFYIEIRVKKVLLRNHLSNFYAKNRKNRQFC